MNKKLKKIMISAIVTLGIISQVCCVKANEIGAEDLISRVVNSYSREYLLEEIVNMKIKYQNDLDTVNKVNNLLGMSECGRDEKLANLQLIFAKSKSIKVPEGYMYTVGGYHILDNLQTVNDIKDLQKVVNTGIAFAEASKFNSWNLQSRILTFEPNVGEVKIDITDKVLKLSSPLIEGTSYGVKSELFWDDFENPLDPSRKNNGFAMYNFNFFRITPILFIIYS